MLKLKEKQREELKKPLGKLVEINDAVKGGIVVGDYSAYQLLVNGKKPRVVIHDYKIMRKEVEDRIRERIESFGKIVIKVENRPGHLEENAILGVRLAIESGRETRVQVEGEEDLLALPAIKFAKIGEKIYYGQPNQGLVEVNVDEKIKRTVGKIISQMEEIS